MNITKIVTTIAASTFVVAAAAGCASLEPLPAGYAAPNTERSQSTPAESQAEFRHDLGASFEQIPGKQRVIVCKNARWFPEEVHGHFGKRMDLATMTVGDLHDALREICHDAGIYPPPRPDGAVFSTKS
jgi:hypothetical protein